MRRMVVFAAVCSDSEAACMRPGILALAIPDGGRELMNRLVPALLIVAIDAQRGAGVVLDQEFAELIVVRIVAGGALHLAGRIKAHALVKGAGVFQLPVCGSEGDVVTEGDRMIVAEIGAQTGRAGR